MQAYSPGRIALLGEHCDWAGGSSLVLPIPLGIRATLHLEAAHSVLRIQSHTLSGPHQASIPPGVQSHHPLRYVDAVVTHARKEGWPIPAGLLQLESDLPMGRGFSSSAALCVVTARILAQNAGLDRTPEDIADLAYRAEREGVGVACGRLDPLACAYAQPLLLRWPESIRPIPVERTVPLVAAAFPTPRNAPGILRALHALHRPHGANEAERAVCETIAIWGQLAEAGADLLRRGQATELGRLLDQAQQLYEERLIPHVPALHAPGLVDACRRLKQAGALGAKFSGAGGDGSVIAIAQDPPHAERLATTLRAQGLLAWSL